MTKSRSCRLVVLVLIVIGLLGGHSVLAQQPPPKTAAQEGFVPVDQLPPVQDAIPAPRLVAAAYAFVWLALFAYLWSIWRRLSKVERELEIVSRQLTSGGRAS